jgi:STE24 endopeptidase
MDILHNQLQAIQHRLSFVSTDPIDWKFYVQVFAWSVTLFESYLMSVVFSVLAFPSLISPRTRQYPLYSKTEPPKALQGHFEKGEFEKSQAYGKDKARFAFVSGLYKQTLDSLMLQFGFYAWSWKAAGCLLAMLGYGAEYQVLFNFNFHPPPHSLRLVA